MELTGDAVEYRAPAQQSAVGASGAIGDAAPPTSR